MTIQELQSRLKSIDELPALPTIVSEINQLLSNPKTTAVELSALIKSDPSITAKLLKIANSAFFAMPKKLTSVNMAIVALGFNTVRSIVLATSVMEVFNFEGNANLSQKRFWAYSMSVAAACRVLARNAQERRTETAFISGLLHGIGRIVFAQYMPKEFEEASKLADEKEISLWEAERELFEFSDCDIGGLLLNEWKLDPLLIDAVSHQEVPSNAPESARAFSAFNLVGSVIVRILQLGDSGDVHLPQLNRSTLNAARVSDAQWDRLLQLTMDEAERASVFLQE